MTGGYGSTYATTAGNQAYNAFIEDAYDNLPQYYQMAMEAYIPALYDSLGLFIPLIVVNCIVLGRAEAFAAKNNPFASLCDGLGIGLGFTFGLTLLGIVRELLGTGALFSLRIFPEEFGVLIFVLAPGAFITLGYLIAIINKIKVKNN